MSYFDQVLDGDVNRLVAAAPMWSSLVARKRVATYAPVKESVRRPAFHALIPLLLFIICVLAGGACSDLPRTEIGEAKQAVDGENPPGEEPGPSQDPTCPPAPSDVASSFPPDLSGSETTPAGTMPGSFSVTPTGEAHYTMPLVVPPGRAGLQPKHSIAYDSSAGDGPLGVGFSLTGFSVITRCPQTVAQDGAIRPVMYDTDDALCLDGRRLVLVGQSAGVHEFRTLPDSFVKVLAYFPSGWDETLGPQTFRVFTKEGLTLEYGGTAENGRAVIPDGTVRAWWMTKTTDRSGNFIEYEYLPRNESAGSQRYTAELVPKEIRYTGHSPSNTPPSRAIIFDYVDKPATATRTFFTRGIVLKSAFLLWGIRTLGPGNQPARWYHLEYETSTNTGRKRLSSVEECTADMLPVCKPETKFTWSAPPRGFQTPSTSTQIETPESPFGSVMPMDVTGDGLDDLVLVDAPEVGGAQPRSNFMVAANLGPTATQPFDTLTLGAQRARPPNAPEDKPLQPELGTPLDYNHDGRMDIFLHDPYASRTTWHVLLTQPNGTFVDVDTSIARHYGLWVNSPQGHGSAHLADVNGDGMPDLINCIEEIPLLKNKWALHLWTADGPGFSTAPIQLPLDVHPCNRELYPVDVDADGRAELVVRDHFLDMNGFPHYTNKYIALGYRAPSSPLEEITLELVASPGGVYWLDVNGDGLPDAIETGWNDRQLRTFLNTGNGFSGSIDTLTPPVLDADEHAKLGAPIDWDGDGMQDLLLPMKLAAGNLPSWVVLRSLGDGQFEIEDTTIPFDAAMTQAGITIADPRGPRVIDADGDGAHDVLLPHNGFFHVHRNLASQPDTLLAVRDGMNPLKEGHAGSLPNVSIQYTTLIDTSITEDAPPGLQDRHTYVSRYDTANGCAYPMRCIVGPRRVVSSYAVFTGAEKPRHFRVRYRDGRWHRLGRGFLGFGERILDDLDKGGGTIEVYDNVTFDPTLNVYPFAGRPVRLLRWNLPWPAPITQPIELGFTSIMYQVVPTSGGSSYFTIPVYRRERREEDIYHNPIAFFDGVEPFVRDAYSGYTSATRLSESIHVLADYDLLGNALEETTFIGRDLPFLNPAAGADTIERVARTFSNDTANWQIGLLEAQEHCSTVGSQTACRNMTRTYDTSGRTKTVAWGTPGDPETQVSVLFSRDGFGNITKTVALDAFEGRRATCTSYEAEGVFPYAQRNAEGHLTLTKFDPRHGGLLATIDPDALTTQWAYDGLGRTKRELRPDGTQTTVGLARLGSGNAGDPWTIQATTTATGAGTEVTEVDPLGRVLRTLSPGVATATTPSPPRILREILYDEYGEHVARRLVPIAENAPQNQRRYESFYRDALGRITNHVSPWDGSTTYTYEGETVRIEDPRSHETVTTLDSLGRPATITDAHGMDTTYTYGPFGVLWRVKDPGEAETVTEHDAYGRVRVANDPDRGVTELHYSGFGDLRWSQDALGRKMTLSRDRLGRVKQRSDTNTTTPGTPVENTYWVWDTAQGKGVGKIASVTSPAGHIERFRYDALGRVANMGLAIDNEAFDVSFAYDPQYGRLATTTTQAPGEAPFVVARDYDAAGHLLAVRDPATPAADAYWTLTATDGAGRITGEKFGNDATTTRTYFADKNRVESIFTQSGTTTLQHLWYTYDDKLNLETRSDYVQIPSKTETFSYDALDRLECASFDALGDPCQRKWEYLDNGNLLVAPGLGQYEYMSRPHVVDKVGAAQFYHDAVGNQIGRPGATIEYTPFDQPKRFTLAGGAVTLDYSGDGARIRKTTPTTVTVYLGGLYERVTHLDSQLVEHRYYISSSERPVAVVTRSAGSTSTLYLHVDNLGSIDVVTNGAGSQHERRSYDPFGARRNPAWGASGPWSPSASTTIGFTGHEADDELGLVHMRGRVYDPTFGRFLTMDPIVSRPLDGQNWNPYAYVLNNPLAYVDPSGFEQTTPGQPLPEPFSPEEILVIGEAPPVAPKPVSNDDGWELPAGYGIVWPTDVGTWGNTARFEPAPPPLPERGPQSGWDIAVSFLRGAVGAYGESVVEGAITAVVTAMPGGLFLNSGYQLLKLWTAGIHEAREGYRADGVMGAVAGYLNVLNPLYHLGVGVTGSVLAVEDKDYQAVGARAFGVGAMVVTAIVSGKLAAAEGAVARGGASTGSGQGGILVRFGAEAESAEALAAGAAKAEAHGFPHGVSTKLVSRLSGSDRAHRSAPYAEVTKHFEVQQTGRNPAHHTVHLPKPVTAEVARLFNEIFQVRQ
ncbi:FG-GAP-like repeat-containing protein [Polyangium mundeleinium]|uniref:FG-GAP-like repeat-containing protein n=1 Tax=Polyangium mundeleinium TaxID=2995306 RepID=A0ABT5F126_9BACT|nr:FG-GAP-like repeat-containing protein [Polyangium mundeleinium]MDC0747778.1 FG-GAP-like repeat-containing protein [Polyangium mundeleinium]